MYKQNIRYYIDFTDINQIKEDLKDGLMPNKKYDSYDTPIEVACKHNKIEIVKLFLDHGATIDTLSARPPIIWIAYNNYIKLLKLIINHGCNLNLMSNSHYTALRWAIVNNNIDMVKMLVKAGCNIHLPQAFIHLIRAIQKNIQVAKFLIKNGCKLRKKDRYGRNYMYYVKKHNLHIIENAKRKRARLLMHVVRYIRKNINDYKKDFKRLPKDLRKHFFNFDL